MANGVDANVVIDKLSVKLAEAWRTIAVLEARVEDLERELYPAQAEPIKS